MKRAPAFCLIALLFLPACQQAPARKLCFDKTCIAVEVAATPKEREKGLMFRESLAQNRGMLFVFDRPYPYPFWMKNTRIPLDMIWLDENKRAVFIYENALPCKDICKSITPPQNALYVVEVNAGFARKHKLRLGDLARLE